MEFVPNSIREEDDDDEDWKPSQRKKDMDFIARARTALPLYIAETEKLRAVIRTLLDQVDYDAGNCGPTEMVGAVLPMEIIAIARAASTGAGKGQG